MAKTRAILKRRKAIRNIRKITRTMELIATARYKKAMDRAVQATAYTTKIGELVANLSRSAASAKHPLLEERETTKKSLVLVLTSNRGLCGGYNGNVIRQAARVHEATIAKHPMDLEVSGKRGVNFVRFRKIPVTKTYTHFEDKPTFAEVEVLANRYIELFLKGEIDRLDVVYTKFFSMGRQSAVIETLLPLGGLTTDADVPKGGGDEQFEFWPSAEDILNEIVPVSFKVRLFKCFLDAAVSEQIARMVAMKGATENAGSLIKALSSRYNRARQAHITNELAEIIGTAEALK